MEIVLALAAVVGISLIAVPRLRRRSRARVRPDAGKQWTTTAAARRNRRPATGNARSGWATRRTAAAAAGAGTVSAVATEPYDEWDDDLDWGGETAVAAPPTAPSAPLPESDLDWQMPGQDGNGAVAEPDEETVWDDWADTEEPAANGNGNGVAPPVPADVAPAADVEPPAPAAPPLNGNGASHRATPHGDARTDAPGTEDDVAFAEPDWDWEPTVSRAPEAAAATAAAPAAPGRLRRARTAGRKVNPLVLVALYALFGIGVIVIAVSVISGAMSGPDTDRTPRTSATVEPTATPTPPAATSTANNAEALRLAQAFADQRVALLAQESRAARDARAATRRARAARRQARAAHRRAAARRARRNAAARTPSTPASPPPTTPAPRPVTPAPSGGGGGGGGGCEFCIG
jgi:hypothetical protein